MTRFRFLLLLGLLACADSSGPTSSDSPGIRVVSAADIRDTVLAILAQPLTVEVRGADGAVQRGLIVEFTGLTSEREPDEPSAFVGPVGGTAKFPIGVATDTTDDAGRASVRVVLGGVAGPGGVIVAVPTLALRHTVPITVLHGQIVIIRTEPADSALYVGRSYQLRTLAGDRWGNWVDTIATYGGVSGGITVSPAGLITGTAIGRAAAAVRVGSWTDSVHTSVVPVGTIAAHVRRRYIGDSIGVAVVNLDGAGFRRIAVETPPRDYGGEEPPGHEMTPRWDPAGTRVVYQESRAVLGGNSAGADQQRLFVTDIAGATRPLFSATTFYTEGQPDFSADGQSIYFVARRPTDLYLHIWRSRADGSAPALVGGVGDNVVETRPSVSPDGQWLAYVASGATVSQSTVRVRNLATGVHTSVAVGGVSPRWSPRGDLIAYVNSADYSGYSGVLRVVRADGSGDRQVVSGVAYHPVIDWSPDGRFIIGETGNYGLLELVDVTTGARIPLPYSGRLSQPAWQPGSSR